MAFTFASLPLNVCTSVSRGAVVVVSDLNKNIGWMDLAEKKAQIGRFAYPYSLPSLLSVFVPFFGLDHVQNTLVVNSILRN